MNRRMVIWADKRRIVQPVLAPATEPVDVVTMTERLPILLARMPETYLTAAAVQCLKLINEARVAGSKYHRIPEGEPQKGRSLWGQKIFARIPSGKAPNSASGHGLTLAGEGR